MSFIGELFDKTGLIGCYCVILFGGQYAYAEGVDRLVGINDSEITFVSNDKTVVIFGNDLQIEDLEQGTIMVKGKIERVEEKQSK